MHVTDLVATLALRVIDFVGQGATLLVRLPRALDAIAQAIDAHRE
jgi:hypothetical protein